MSDAHRAVRIVIVEDEPAIASALRVQLGLLGFGETRWATNRTGALRLVEEDRPDLVIMDIQLADGDDGARVALELRETWNIPSVFLTAHTDDATIERCKAAEPAAYLLKPFNLQLLKVTLEMALHRESAVRARAEAEAQKRRTESLYRAIVENAPIAILSATSAGTVLKANAAAERLFSRGATEFAGSPVALVLQDLPEPHSGVTHYTTTAFTPAGRTIPVAVCALCFEYEGTDLTNYFVSDLRERLALEDQLTYGHESDAITALTSDVAHDLNNLLASLQTLQFLLEQPRQSPVPAPATALEQVVERGALLTDQLVQLGLPGDDRVQSVSLHEYLHQSTHLFRRLLGDSRSIQVVDRCPNAEVYVNPQKLRRALFHLIHNARQATPDTGRLTLTIESGTAAMVELCVTDDGVGMAPDVAVRAFEPFFSTRTGDEAHGLGLAIVQRTVESFGGQVSLRSNPGQGTTVSLLLPMPTSERKQAGEPATLVQRASNL